MKKSINDRCPLQVECERKRCDFIHTEMECPYYSANARKDYYIDDVTGGIGSGWMKPSLLRWVTMTMMTLPTAAWSISPSNSSTHIPTTPGKTWAT